MQAKNPFLEEVTTLHTRRVIAKYVLENKAKVGKNKLIACGSNTRKRLLKYASNFLLTRQQSKRVGLAKMCRQLQTIASPAEEHLGTQWIQSQNTNPSIQHAVNLGFQRAINAFSLTYKIPSLLEVALELLHIVLEPLTERKPRDHDPSARRDLRHLAKIQPVRLNQQRQGCAQFFKILLNHRTELDLLFVRQEIANRYLEIRKRQNGSPDFGAAPGLPGPGPRRLCCSRLRDDTRHLARPGMPGDTRAGFSLFALRRIRHVHLLSTPLNAWRVDLLRVSLTRFPHPDEPNSRRPSLKTLPGDLFYKVSSDFFLSPCLTSTPARETRKRQQRAFQNQSC